MMSTMRLSSRAVAVRRGGRESSRAVLNNSATYCAPLVLNNPRFSTSTEQTPKKPSEDNSTTSGSTFQSAFDKLKSVAGHPAVRDSFEKVNETVKEASSKVTDTVKDASSKVNETVKEASSKVNETVKEASSKASEAFSQASEKFTSSKESDHAETKSESAAPEGSKWTSKVEVVVDLTKSFTADVVNDIRVILDPEARKERNRAERAKKYVRQPLVDENAELPEGQEYSTRTELVIQPVEKSSWEKAHEKFAETKVYKKGEELFDKFKNTSAYKATQEMRDKMTEKREDFDEYLDTTQNPLVINARETMDSMLAPTDQAVAMEELYYRDPHFSLVDFLEEMEHDVIPVFVDAWLAGDMQFMDEFCEANALRTAKGEFVQRQTLGHYYDTSVLDISNVSFVDCLLTPDDNEPVLQILFMVQHVNCTRDIAGDIVDGSMSQIRTTHFVWVVRRDFSGKRFMWKLREYHAQGIMGFII